MKYNHVKANHGSIYHLEFGELLSICNTHFRSCRHTRRRRENDEEDDEEKINEVAEEEEDKGRKG